MDKYKKLSLDEKINQIKEDYNSEWWRPSKIDNYDLTNKLLRVGCRPLNRKYIKCKQNIDSGEDFRHCVEIKKELSECQDLLYTLYYNSKRDEVIKNS